MKMKKVIAALDNSPAASAVVATAASLASLFGAEVDPIHVVDGDDALAVRAAESVGLDLRRLRGPALRVLIDAADGEDVVAVVVGTRSLPLASRPVGATALKLITSLVKPVVIVPPDARRPGTLKRVLVPLEGTVSSSLAPKALVELAPDANLEIIVLHVHDATTLPAFTDQPQHEGSAWRDEFVARYCPWGIGGVTVELRVGRREEEILRAAVETKSDLIALGWAQELAGGRAPVVRETLERGHIPVLLLPVHVGKQRTNERGKSWNSLQLSRA
jgi:nucleotide-binding universal stress UspA family protein